MCITGKMPTLLGEGSGMAANSRKIQVGVLLVLSWAGLNSARAELRAGVAAVKITPPNGTPMAGYYYARGSEDVLDDLYAKAAVLDDGSTKVALVVCDLITLPRKTVLEARQLIEQQTGIPGRHVMISATHTHTGPTLARDSVRDNQDGGSSDPSQKYTLELPSRIAQAVTEANGKLTGVRASYAREHEDRLSFCRRYWIKDGTVGWNPGKLNPNVIRPVSPLPRPINHKNRILCA
jgi:neutral ceramidase